VEYANILVRATNWVGDAVLSLPALRAIRTRFQRAQITVLARPSVADIYAREGFRLLEYTAPRGFRGIREQWAIARDLREERFDCAVLLQNAFEAAALAMMAGIPERIGYDRDARGWLLTEAIPVPKPGEIPVHQRYYYLEMLRRANWLPDLPEVHEIRLEGLDQAREAGRELFAASGAVGDVIGISPGAAYGTAKQWIPEHFAGAAEKLARALNAGVAVFGSRDEAGLCESVERQLSASGVSARNFAGKTTLREFIDMASACRVFLTNDSGAMHIASAAGVPTVSIFGATDHLATGPTGTLARVVREPVSCSPCLLRECPIDHRCMTRVTPERVVDVALDLLSAHTGYAG
jgi:heptosyltransferase II